MSSGTPVAATIDDLYRVEGKAELIAGRIVPLMPMGHNPSQIVSRILLSLDDNAEANGRGVVCTGKMAFVVPQLSSGRESFSPDASYYDGPLPSNGMNFIQGPPTLAVEVRSKSDYGNTAEAEMAAKRADYFEAGTKVVWDVDPIGESIRKYRRDSPDQPAIFTRGEKADAEPAVPGWRMATDRIFA